MNNVEFKKVLVTPEIAQELLSKHVINRKVSKNKVNALITDIEKDNWICDTGETIKFNSEGALIDGRHRLYAIIESKKSQYCYLANNCDMEAQKVIDGGNRNVKDMFLVMQIDNYDKVSMIVKNLTALLFKTNRRQMVREKIFTNMFYKDFYNENKNLIDFAAENFDKIANSKKAIKLIPKSMILTIGAYLMYKGYEYENVNEFLQFIVTGSNIPMENIENVWDQLWKLKEKDKSYNTYFTYQILFKCFEYYITNNQKKISIKEITEEIMKK